MEKYNIVVGTFFRSPGTRYSSRRGLEGVKQEGAPGGIVGSPGNLPTIGRYTSVVMPYIWHSFGSISAFRIRYLSCRGLGRHARAGGSGGSEPPQQLS